MQISNPPSEMGNELSSLCCGAPEAEEEESGSRRLVVAGVTDTVRRSIPAE